MNAAQLINQSSGDVEIYTPPEILDRARQVLGRIDIDPASSAAANVRVKARKFYCAPVFETLKHRINRLPVRAYVDEGGLSLPWKGHAFMNPPFTQLECACRPWCAKERCKRRGWHTASDLPGTGEWVQQMEREHAVNNVTQAIVVTFAATSEQWFQPLLNRPQCFPSPRTNYLKPDGSVYRGVTKGSAITYYGPDVARFERAFRDLGTIKIPFAAW